MVDRRAVSHQFVVTPTMSTAVEQPHADCHEQVAMWESWADEAKKEIRKLQAEVARLTALIDGQADA